MCETTRVYEISQRYKKIQSNIDDSSKKNGAKIRHRRFDSNFGMLLPTAERS